MAPRTLRTPAVHNAASMILHPSLADEPTRTAAYPIAQAKLFLAHSAVSPLPRVAMQAAMDWARQAAFEGQMDDVIFPRIAHARRAAARLMGVGPSEISLLGPTSLGLSLIAHGLDWAPGDQVLYLPECYPANVYCWQALAQRGVEPVPIRPQAYGCVRWDDIAPLITSRTRLLALASCHFLTGYRPDLAYIAAEASARGVLICLDAIQTLGAFPTQLEKVDFAAADAHKWLLGPGGAGVLYVRADRARQIRPALLGSFNIDSPRFHAQADIRFEQGGRRFEPGMINIPGVEAMAASMNLLADVGTEQTAAAIGRLHALARELLSPLGFEWLLPRLGVDPADSQALSGILSLLHPEVDLARLEPALLAAGLVVTIRHLHDGRPVLRIAPHFYNTPDELQRAARILHDALAQERSA